MLRIELIKFDIEYFKGLRRFSLQLDGNDAAITGENETKKTTIKDAFHWLLFDKSSDGKPSSGKGHFGLRPHYKNGEDIHGITVAVEAEMKFDRDGTVEFHALKKEQTENVLKGVIKGYPNSYYIDDVLVLKKDFDEFINGYISEDIFKHLTDVFFFCGGLHHLERRKFLVRFAEDAGQPEGFECLFERAKGRTLENYKKALLLQRDGTKDKDGYKGEIEKIPTKIKTILEGMVEPDKDIEDLEEQKRKLEKEKEKLRDQRQKILDTETERQNKIESKNQLVIKQDRRASDLSNDPVRIKDLQYEKNNLLEGLQKLEGALRYEQSKLNEKKEEKEKAESSLKIHLLSLEDARKDKQVIEQEKESTNCYACNQKLPKGKLAENKAKKEKKLKCLVERCEEIKSMVDAEKKNVTDLETSIAEQSKLLEAFASDVKEKQQAANRRLGEIAEAVKSLPEPDVTKDEVWMNYDREIKKLKAEIGEPVNEQLREIEIKLTTKEEELKTIETALALPERFESDKERIRVLEAREKELGQLIADIDKEIDLIKQYNLAYSRLIEEEVNDRFKYVTFKLFEIQINGEIDDRVCEAMIEGTRWGDMSHGQSIRAGTDVINTLSEFYDVSVPLFIDHAESMTHPIEAKAQKILLRAQEDVKTLQTKIIEKSKKAVA